MTAGPGQPLGLDLIWLRPERTARDQRPALSRAEIVRTAIEIADEQGLEAMSTRGIAARLGSSPTSLYWHVPSKADLHELVFDAVMGEIELPEPLCGALHLSDGAADGCGRFPRSRSRASIRSR